MLLYLNTDGDDKTGWLGYDFVVNRRSGSGTTSLERNVGGRYQLAARRAGPIPRRSGNEMEIAIPRAAARAGRAARRR